MEEQAAGAKRRSVAWGGRWLRIFRHLPGVWVYRV